MVHPRSRFAGREKVGEVGNRLKHFLNAAPSLFLAARGASRVRRASGNVQRCYRLLPGSEWLGRYSPPEFAWKINARTYGGMPPMRPARESTSRTCDFHIRIKPSC